MDAVFGPELGSNINNNTHWDVLKSMTDRYVGHGILIGEEPIAEMSREEASKHVHEYLDMLDQGYAKEDYIIGYFNEYDNEIYLLRPLKMALILGMYDEAIYMLEKDVNHKITISEWAAADEVRITTTLFYSNWNVGTDIRDLAFISGACKSVEDLEKLQLWNHFDTVTLLSLMIANKGIPDKLNRLLMERFEDEMEMDLKKVYDFANKISINKVTPKQVMNILNITESVLYAESLSTYVMNMDISVNTRNKKQDVLVFKGKLQLQLDLVKYFLAKGLSSNVYDLVMKSRIVYREGLQLTMREELEWDLYTDMAYERITALIRQRNLMLKSCISDKKLYEMFYITMAHDMATICRIYDSVMDSFAENRANYSKKSGMAEWKALVDCYDNLLRNNVPKDWNKMRAFSEYRNSGVFFLGQSEQDHINALSILSDVTGMTFETQFSEGFCDWLGMCFRYIIHRERMYQNDDNSPFGNPFGSPFSNPLEEHNLMDVDDSRHKTEAIRCVESALGRIEQVKGTPLGSKSCERAYKRAVNELIKIDSEDLIWSLSENGILNKEGLEIVIENGISQGKINLVPLMLAIKMTKLA